MPQPAESGEQDPSKTPAPDKTGIENEDDPFADLPEEDDGIEDTGNKKADPKVDRSEIAQKIKYREKYKETKSLLEQAENTIKELSSRKGTSEEKPSDEKELAAQRYIKKIADDAIADYIKNKESAEKREVEEFENAVEEILDDNPEITRDDLLKVVEDFDVEPATALKILQRQTEVKGNKPKPKMPAPKRGSDSQPKAPIDDSKKSMWEIAQDVIREVREKAV